MTVLVGNETGPSNLPRLSRLRAEAQFPVLIVRRTDC